MINSVNAAQVGETKKDSFCFDNLTNLFPLVRTLRFKMLPVGKTEEYFNAKLLLEADEQREKERPIVQEMIDDHHRAFISDVLSKFSKNEKYLPCLDVYAALYLKSRRTKEEEDQMKEAAKTMRAAISEAFLKDERYEGLFNKDLIKITLAENTTDENREILSHFSSFTTYFLPFFENRKNMYTGEGKHSEITYRIVDQNLPRFLDNVKIWRTVRELLSEETLKEIKGHLEEKLEISSEDAFSVDFFTRVLAQEDIDAYNQLLGGFSKENGEKVKGLNEYINELMQKTDTKIPKLSMLYKQILSDSTTVSYIPQAFFSSEEVLKAIRAFYLGGEESKGAKTAFFCLTDLLKRLNEFDPAGIFIHASAVTDLSNLIFGDWKAVQSGWEKAYDSLYLKIGKKTAANYEEKRSKEYKKQESISLSDFCEYGNAGTRTEGAEKGIDKEQVYAGIKNHAEDLWKAVETAYEGVKFFLSCPYEDKEPLFRNEKAIACIKAFMDALKALQKFAKQFSGTGRESEKDALFYSAFDASFDVIQPITLLYNRVRNYATQKPYSKDKIKLNFNNVSLLAGWDVNKEADDRGVLLRKGDDYYLAIVEKEVKYKEIVWEAPQQGESYYRKMVLKQIPNAAKYFSIKQFKPQNPSDEVLRLISSKDKKAFSRKERNTLINYVIYDFIPYYQPLHDAKGRCYFQFRFRAADEYDSWNEFCKDIEQQAYSVAFENVSETYINQLVEEGKIYLFKIYNKDFSDASKGTPNLHTMYFRALFEEENLKNTVYALNGGAELFYRKASIDPEKAIMHKANHSIENRHPINGKKESLFCYDIVKDHRFTEREFFFHVPMEMNYGKPRFYKLNDAVRTQLKNSRSNYVIGIDRGERNLIYICLIDGEGRIVKQFSGNTVDRGENRTPVDYHGILAQKEEKRREERQSWKTIEDIREMKEGYLSQIVNTICKLAEEYNAVIALEDLNSGFKNSRSKIEKAVYQKFETMLVNKLSYYVNKKKDKQLPGGLYHAYQLASPELNKGQQNGILFYVPAWLTSKIDPATGFVDLLKPRYESVAASVEFLKKFKDIRFNEKEQYFEFEFSYDDFKMNHPDFRRNWTVTSCGKRIRSFRDPQTNRRNYEEVDLTKEFAALFSSYGIEYTKQLKEKILEQSEKQTEKKSPKEFYQKLLGLLALTYQLRNSASETDVDYIASPVKDSQGHFFHSDNSDGTLPTNADANGAYHIALKGLWTIQQIQKADSISKVRLSISNKEWLEFVQGKRQ